MSTKWQLSNSERIEHTTSPASAVPVCKLRAHLRARARWCQWGLGAPGNHEETHARSNQTLRSN